MNIVCLKWGNEFGPRYVNNLYNGIKKNSTTSNKFYCLTEDNKGINPKVEILKLPDLKLQAWWNKIYLFHSQSGLSGQTLYIDLDTIITNNIDEILTKTYDFAALKNLDIEGAPMGSGVMAWNHEDYRYLWNKFQKSQCEEMRGDQDYISKHVSPRFFQDLFPNKFKSYKLECYEEGGPNGASIVYFHGKPRPHEAISTSVQGWPNGLYNPREWVKDYFI